MIKVINKNTLDYETDRNAVSDARINQYTDISLSASETNDTITINMQFMSNVPNIPNYTLSKVFYKNEYKNTIADITCLKKKVEAPYDLLIITRKANRVVAPVTTPTNYRLLPYATIFITDDITWIIPRVRLTNTSNKFDNSEYSEEYFGTRTTQQVLFSHCPEAKLISDKWYVKKEALSDSIDVNTSISYLENQVDVLYKILNKLIEKTGIDVSEYQDIINSVDKNSSLNINSLEKVNNKISKNKKHIRDRQKVYYRMLKEAGLDA